MGVCFRGRRDYREGRVVDIGGCRTVRFFGASDSEWGAREVQADELVKTEGIYSGTFAVTVCMIDEYHFPLQLLVFLNGHFVLLH